MYFLLRYKHLVEWFDRERVYAIFEGSKRPRENYLALDAYRFLFLEGMEFHLAPSCMIGAIDFISEMRKEGRLLFDDKVYRSGRTAIVEGFNQLLSYLKQYNHPWGALLIYDVNTDRPLQLDFPVTDFEVPFTDVGGKTIFFLRVDIAKHESASIRGKLKPTIIEKNTYLNRLRRRSSTYRSYVYTVHRHPGYTIHVLHRPLRIWREFL